jgi:hypothetical protein
MSENKANIELDGLAEIKVPHEFERDGFGAAAPDRVGRLLSSS